MATELKGQIRLATNTNSAAAPYIGMDDHPNMCYEADGNLGGDWGSFVYNSDMGVSVGEVTANVACNYFFPNSIPTILYPTDDNSHPCTYSIFETYDCVGEESSTDGEATTDEMNLFDLTNNLVLSVQYLNHLH